MRFWVIYEEGTAVGCEMTWRKAKSTADEMGIKKPEIRWVECPVNADTIRRLLGGIGGYATEIERD